MSTQIDLPNGHSWDADGSNVGGAPKSFTACYVNHKELSIGGGIVVGASAHHPRDGYDIYVGLDHDMRRIGETYPWEPEKEKPKHQFVFRISDGCAPKDVSGFQSMVEWLGKELAGGARVHIGCIGGHGRTGMLITALRAHCDGDKDALAWVRANHCTKAVETQRQVDFLVKTYGITGGSGSKSEYKDANVWSGDNWHYVGGKTGKAGKASKSSYAGPKSEDPIQVRYIEGPENIW